MDSDNYEFAIIKKSELVAETKEYEKVDAALNCFNKKF